MDSTPRTNLMKHSNLLTILTGSRMKTRVFYFALAVAAAAIATSCVKDENGKVIEVHATYDPETRGGDSPDGRKVKGTIHWVSASDCVSCEIRLYDRLFAAENPFVDGKENYLNHLNPNSLEIIEGCLIEGSIANAKCGDTFQFMRQGYFCVDKTSSDDKLIFNRTVALNTSWK